MAYTDTFITIAADCPIDSSEIPISNREKKPIHIIQYELLMQKPYTYDHKTLLFETYLIKESLQDISADEKQIIWHKLFSKGQPCLRASALTKRYGFGAHYNDEGKIALYPMESKSYKKFVNSKEIEKRAGMKNKR